MSKRPNVTIDGNEAAAFVAHKVSEVIAIYPITPSSPMGEWSDQWSAEGKTNIWGAVPSVVEMQSEGGASAALHGALQGGSLATTFTSSQGLLLMIPTLYKIAGELTPATLHVAARTVATHALSIFGDHSDVMAVRQTGFGLLASNSVQEVMDQALIATAASLEAQIPFIHFFDGFRTTHEVAKIERLDVEDLRDMITDEMVERRRQQAMTPDHPVLRGTAQNPDHFFQAREGVNPYYLAAPTIVQTMMDRFAALTGRQYRLFDYSGAPDAERIVVLMGSGAEAAEETVKRLVAQGEKVGMVKVRLFRPFSVEHFAAAIPESVKAIAVLDRTKEPGSVGEPLYQDVVTGLNEAARNPMPRVVGGRYGLSSKEFTPAMVKGIFDELSKPAPKNHFTVGIHDDVTHTSLDWDPEFSTEDPETVRCLFYGLGADGTVGANKNSIKIIGEETDNYAQGYFVYDSKKAGAVTVSHLRFGPRPIQSTYLISQANFVACHQFQFLEARDVLKEALPGATFLLNSPFGPDEVWEHLPVEVRRQIIAKKLKFYVIDGYEVARETGMGRRINTIMQTCFFAISGVLPPDEAIRKIKEAIKKTYGKRGEHVVQKNFAAVDTALNHLHEVTVPEQAGEGLRMSPTVSEAAPEFVQNVVAPILRGDGDLLPVSALSANGSFPTGTAMWEKRNIALEVPVWDENLCIQCGKCVLVCPHAVIRSKVYAPEGMNGGKPEAFKSTTARWKDFRDQLYTLQVAVEDCTGCAVCVEICPAKDKSDASRKAINMQAQAPLRETERANWEYFTSLPEMEQTRVKPNLVKDVQLLQPLFEFSGACAGCGETPYIKLLTQLFGDRMIIGNATGCSSIYGGNLPTTPYTTNPDGRGPTWNNSLFEDNAEFTLGLRLAVDQQTEFARSLLAEAGGLLNETLVDSILKADQSGQAGIDEQRARVVELRKALASVDAAEARRLELVADYLVKKSVWAIGGDGWAYDIGYGGLDHVLSTGRNVNILVLDTEVYSNTGGQASKSTPRAAVAKFAFSGKPMGKKDLSMMALQYGNVYVGRVAMGYNDSHTVKTMIEAEAHDGPSIVIAYSHCIAHGYDLVHGFSQQKLAVQSGAFPIFRYDPSRADHGENPFELDSKPPSVPLEKYAYNETRYTMLARFDPEGARRLMDLAQEDARKRFELYQHMAAPAHVGAEQGKTEDK